MAMPENIILSLRGIKKVFPGVIALDNASLHLRAGEIHALLGENGAGKSTLIKVMTGVYERDGGEQIIDGQHVRPVSVADAQRLGISSVYQEINLLPNLTVAQNIFLGREPKKFGLVHWSKMNAQSTALLEQYNIRIDVTQPLANYSVAIQQMVAIARGVEMSAKVLILDEPTASLDQSEVLSLFAIMRQLRDRGLAVLFVTHFLSQVYEICDRITVLRNGKFIAEHSVSSLPEQKLVSLMLGKELQSNLAEVSNTDPKQVGDPILSINNASVKNRLYPIDFNVYPAEVVGLAGLLGSGRTELCEMIFASHPATTGRVSMGSGQPISHNREAIANGMGLCPEDRKRDGIFAGMSIRENITIALQVKNGWWRNINKKQRQKIADYYIKVLAIATPDADKAIGELSGGNQQKVILARWLATQPKLLLLDEPTRGIDIGAHAEIIRLIRKLCNDGMALIVASSEIDELVHISSRVLVMRDRRMACELVGEEVNQNAIMRAIAGAQ